MYALVNIDYIPLQFVRSYKKFYNLIKQGNDYNLRPLK